MSTRVEIPSRMSIVARTQISIATRMLIVAATTWNAEKNQIEARIQIEEDI